MSDESSVPVEREEAAPFLFNLDFFILSLGTGIIGIAIYRYFFKNTMFNMAESTDEKHNNWLRVLYGLWYVRYGLQGYVDGKGKKQYETFMKNVKPKCSNNTCDQCQVNKQCKPSKIKETKQSQLKRGHFCDEMIMEIKNNHVQTNPMWVNTDSTKWHEPDIGYWEVAKCYLSTAGYFGKTPDDVDASGLLSICIHSLSINNNITNIEHFKEARNIRNNTLHDPYYRIDKKTADECLDKMIAVLEDPRVLVDNKCAKEAVDTIKQIKAKTAKTPAFMTETLDKCVKTNVPVEQTLKEIEMQMDLPRRLAAYYQRHLNSAPISPLMSDKDERLDKFYVPPKIVEKNPRKVGAAEKEKGTPVTTYRQMFCKEDTFNKTVFIVGEAGMGKSSCAAMCALKWANQLSSSNSCAATDRDSGIESTDTASDTEMSIDTLWSHVLDWDLQQMFFSEKEEDDQFQDDTFFKEIGVLFHVSLRDSCDICNLKDIIRDQLINRIYEPEESDDAYTIMKNVLYKQKCVIIADGLDEWSHPDGTKCSCKEEDKVIPYLAPTINATVLITSRPWRMAQQRVKDTTIDIYLEIEGAADVKLLVQKTLNSLNETVTEKKTLLDFVKFVDRMKVKHLLSVPIMSMLLVCLWFEGMHDAFSRCDIYAYTMQMMFKRKSLPMPTASLEFRPFPRCFQHTEYVQKYYGIVMEMAQLAFSTLFSNDRMASLVFKKVDMFKHDHHLEFVLKSGIMQETKTASWIRKTSNYSFIHKTVQEFLAAVYMSYHHEEFQTVVAPFYKKYGNMSDVSQIFIFMCGLNIELANEMSNMMSQSVSIDYNAIDIKAAIVDIQSTIVSGYKEAKANQVSDIQLSLYSFDFRDTSNRSEVNDLLRMNKSKVRHIIEGTSISKKKLEEVFSSSTDTLTYVGIDNVDGQYDLSACNRLQHLAIDGANISDIVVNTESLVSLQLNGVSENVENKLLLSLQNGCGNLKGLKLWSLTNISLFCQTLPLLTHLEILHINFTDLDDQPLLLPASVTSVTLLGVRMTARSLRELVERLKHCTHSVKCELNICTVKPTTEYEEIKRYIQTSEQFRVGFNEDKIFLFSKK